MTQPLPLLSTACPKEIGQVRRIELVFDDRNYTYQIPTVQRHELGDGIVLRLQDGRIQIWCGDLAAEAADYLFGRTQC